MSDPDWAAAISGQDGAVKLALRVQPGARRSSLVGVYGDRLRVAVKAPPVDGRANVELVKLIAAIVGLPRRSVTLGSGHGSRHKSLIIDATLAQVHTAVAKVLAPSQG